MIKKVIIDEDKVYELPSSYSVIHYKESILIIAPEYFNYIVLQNEEQLHIFQALQGSTIHKIVNMYPNNLDDIREVITQIEAKKFTNQIAYKREGRLQLHLFLTNKCNLRCKHCYMFSGEKSNDELSELEIRKILNGFRQKGGECLILSGGEVATRNDLLDIIDYAHTIGLETSIMTNGTLWSEQMIKEVCTKIKSVQISLDGFNEEENALVRGTGYFDKTMRTIDLFLKENVKTAIAVTPWPCESLNSKKEQYIQFEKDLKEKYHDKQLIVKYTADLMEGRELHLTEDQRDEYFKIMLDISNGYEGLNEEDRFVLQQKQNIIKDNWCTYGHLTITATGDVYFCGKITEIFPYGNIRDVSMDKIMADAAKAKSLSAIQHIVPCKDCELRYICAGDCRIKYCEPYKNCKSICDYPCSQIFYRSCSPKHKEHFYEMLIHANSKLYR